MMRCWLFAVLAALTLLACDDGSSDERDATPRPDAAADGMVDTDRGPADDGGPDDRGVDPDARPDDVGVDPDMRRRDADPPPTPVEDCEDACDRYAACERLDIFGDYDNCIDTCGRASRQGPPANWFDCLEQETNCGLLQLCRVPEPPPLTCAEVCAGLDGCGVELPFPDCEAECEAQNAVDPDEAPFSRCGEAVTGVCDVDGWWQCAGAEVYNTCQRRCDSSIACNLVRPDGCLQACIGERFADDPLARRRGEQRTQCVNIAGNDCPRIDACLNPQAAPVVPGRDVFCGVFDGCFFEFGIPCEEAYAIDQEQPGFVSCVWDQIRNGCPFDPFIVFDTCFQGGGPVGPGCLELCEARDLCGDLPAGQNRQGCLTECNDALVFGSEDARQRQQALFPCGIAQDCEALAECLGDNSPVAACEAHCATLAGCGLGAADCVATCNADFFRARAIGYRDCVSTAGDDCGAVAACSPGEPIGCVELCGRFEGCGERDPNCLSRCDDESYSDPAAATARLACALGAPLCDGSGDGVFACREGAANAGAACVGWCRAQTGCDADDVSGLVDCLVSCGEGLRGVEGERFAAAKGCLERADVNGACGPLAACIPAAGALDCAGWCGPLDACGEAPADCGGVCADDALARFRQAQQGECLDAAGGRCAAVEACIAGPEVAPGPIDPAAFCGQYRACGLEDFLPCDFIIDGGLGLGDDIVACFAASLNPCPNDPIEVFNRCLEGGVGRSPNLGACRELCEVRARCADLDGAIRDCTAACVVEVEQRPDELEAALLPCGAALTCGEYAACFAANDPANACTGFCAGLAACGLAADDCEARCGADFFRDRQVAWRQCVVEAGDACGAVAACDPGVAWGCGAQCDRLRACGLAGANCEADCDDAHFADAAQAAWALACVTSAPLCQQGGQSVDACLRDPMVAGAECLAFCRFETGCDAAEGEALAACIAACGEGFVGDDGIRFAAARSCLGELHPFGACAELAGCVPAAAVVDCEGWCPPLEACDAAPADCAGVCPGDELARLRAAVEPVCFAEAGAACDAVLACVEPAEDVLPPVDVDALCRAYDRCGFEELFGIPCFEVVREFDEAGLRCLQENLGACPPDPFVLFDICFEGGEPGSTALAPCARLCEAQGRCGAIDGTIRECTAACAVSVERAPAGLQAALLPCRLAGSCDELAACVVDNGPAGRCAPVCDVAVGCGAFPDEAACQRVCGDVLLAPFVPRDYLADVGACLDGLDGAACRAEGAACFEIAVGDCGAACAAIFGCGAGEGDPQECVAQCEQDPSAGAIIECILATLRPDEMVCDFEALDRCAAEVGGNDGPEPPPPPR